MWGHFEPVVPGLLAVLSIEELCDVPKRTGIYTLATDLVLGYGAFAPFWVWGTGEYCESAI